MPFDYLKKKKKENVMPFYFNKKVTIDILLKSSRYSLQFSWKSIKNKVKKLPMALFTTTSFASCIFA
jgi:hypothetical protein